MSSTTKAKDLKSSVVQLSLCATKHEGQRNTRRTINIDGELGLVTYSVGRLCPMQDMFEHYCSEKKIERTDYVFSIGSCVLTGTETPQESNVRNGYWLYATEKAKCMYK